MGTPENEQDKRKVTDPDSETSDSDVTELASVHEISDDEPDEEMGLARSRAREKIENGVSTIAYGVSACIATTGGVLLGAAGLAVAAGDPEAGIVLSALGMGAMTVGCGLGLLSACAKGLSEIYQGSTG